jgi:hypothetical protein
MESVLDSTAGALGAMYGMSADQMIAYVALGDRQHPDAPTGECGAVDPRDGQERFWCRRPVSRCCGGMHNRYRLEEDWQI